MASAFVEVVLKFLFGNVSVLLEPIQSTLIWGAELCCNFGDMPFSLVEKSSVEPQLPPETYKNEK